MGLTRWVVLLSLLTSGCKDAQTHERRDALNHARVQAAFTGNAQKVVWTDKDGSTVTTIVEPPSPGDPSEKITTTKTAPQH